MTTVYQWRTSHRAPRGRIVMPTSATRAFAERQDHRLAPLDNAVARLMFTMVSVAWT